MGEVVQLHVEPKVVKGRARNKEWIITYNLTTKTWKWQVTITLSPQVFSGEASTFDEAQRSVDTLVKKQKKATA